MSLHTTEQLYSLELQPGEVWPSAADTSVDPRVRVQYLLRSLEGCVQSGLYRVTLLDGSQSADKDCILATMRNVQERVWMFGGAVRSLLPRDAHPCCTDQRYVAGLLQEEILFLGLAMRRVCLEEEKDPWPLRRGFHIHLAMAQDYIGWIRDCLCEDPYP
jgi:hypothetical protein